MQTRRVRAALVACLSLMLALALVGCSSGGTSSANSSGSAVAENSSGGKNMSSGVSVAIEAEAEKADTAESSSAQDESGAVVLSSLDIGETQRIGNDTVGYVDVPASWARFHDASGSGVFQYCDGTEYNVISLDMLDEVVDEYNAQYAASAMWQYMEIEGAQDINGAMVEIGGYEAFQVYGAYPDGVILVTYFFEAEDGMVHYAAAEGLDETLLQSTTLLERTFSFTA